MMKNVARMEAEIDWKLLQRATEGCIESIKECYIRFGNWIPPSSEEDENEMPEMRLL